MSLESILIERTKDMRPEKREGILKATEGMSEKQKEEFVMSMDMADSDFQAEVAPYLGYEGEIDPSIAEFVPTPGMDAQSTLQGAYVSEKGKSKKIPYRGDDGRRQSIELQPGKVNAVGARSANPKVWGHEYKHAEDTDGSETYNRMQDLTASQNEGDFSSSLQMILDDEMSRIRRNYVKKSNTSEEKAKLKNAFDLLSGIEYEAPDMDRDQLKEAFHTASENTIYLDIKGMLKRIEKEQPKRVSPFVSSLINGAGDIEMPEEYRAGGRVKLI